MKKFFFSFFLSFSFVISSFGQESNFAVPVLQNIYTNEEDTRFKPIFSFYANNSDVAVFFSGGSRGFELPTSVLLHFKTGWYVIYNIDINMNIDTTSSQNKIKKLDQSVGDSIWKVLIENHLFDIEDERIKKPKNCAVQVFDGMGCGFHIITPSSYKTIFFYEPRFYQGCSNEVEKKWITNCINVFEKYLGN